MNIYRVAFIGHRRIEQARRIEDQIEVIAKNLLKQKEYVEFYVEERAIDQVVDWFGKEVKIENEGGRYKVSLLVSPNAMAYWALQYVKFVEVISPAFLRERIKTTLENGAAKYQ